MSTEGSSARAESLWPLAGSKLIRCSWTSESPVSNHIKTQDELPGSEHNPNTLAYPFPHIPGQGVGLLFIEQTDFCTDWVH